MPRSVSSAITAVRSYPPHPPRTRTNSGFAAYFRFEAGKLELDEEGIGFDVFLVCDWLRTRGELQTVGGEAYISGLLDGCVPESARSYANRIRELADRRHPALTIYSQDFAVVRQHVRLNVQSGTTNSTNVRYDGISAQLEPDSVVLRDPSGKHAADF